MPMLHDPGPGHLPLCVVDDGIPLEVGKRKHLALEAQRAVFERAELVAKKGIERAGVDYQRVALQPILPVGEKVDSQIHGDPLEQPLEQAAVPLGRDPLPAVGVIVVVEIAAPAGGG